MDIQKFEISRRKIILDIKSQKIVEFPTWVTVPYYKIINNDIGAVYTKAYDNKNGFTPCIFKKETK